MASGEGGGGTVSVGGATCVTNGDGAAQAGDRSWDRCDGAVVWNVCVSGDTVYRDTTNAYCIALSKAGHRNGDNLFHRGSAHKCKKSAKLLCFVMHEKIISILLDQTYLLRAEREAV